MRDQTWVTGDGISLDNCSLETFTIPISTNVLSSNPAEPQHYVIKSVTCDRSMGFFRVLQFPPLD